MTIEGVENVEFKIAQEKYPDELLPGEAIVVTGLSGGRNGLILCCPNCGKSSGSDYHAYDKETKTYSPSIVHDCGWHGFLKNGKFSNA